MDYERKYKEALGKARKHYKETPNNVYKAMLEQIFPDLKESEDERISKEIIKYLEQTVPHNHRDEVLKSKEWFLGLKSKVSRTLIGVKRMNAIWENVSQLLPQRTVGHLKRKEKQSIG